MWNNKSSSWTNLLLPSLILLSLFLNFLDHHHYNLISAEVLWGTTQVIVVALVCSLLMMISGRLGRSLILVGLLLFFIDVQFNWLDEITMYAKIPIGLGLIGLAWALDNNFGRIAMVFFSTVFVVTLVQLHFSREANEVRFKGKMIPGGNHRLPRLIHIIFDEHIGLEGIPVDIDEGKLLKEQLIRFYKEFGFRTFGAAYSHYADTLNSISNTLNFSNQDENLHFLSSDDVTPNSYFDALIKKGYQLNVLQSPHLNVCSTPAIANCLRYPWGLSALERTNIPKSEKLSVIYSALLQRSSLFRRASSVYETVKQHFFGRGMPPTEASWDQPADLHTLNVLQTLDGLWDDIANLPPGNALFAHLLFPHAPYIANPDCSIKYPIYRWKTRGLRHSTVYNTEASRKEHYRHYFEQLHCVQMKLGQLFERMKAAGIYDDSIIILHGDHGSRIVITDPIPKNQNKITKRDVTDQYSTLFAVKAPGVHAGYDTAPRPLEQLLANFVSGDMTPALDFASEAPECFVYLTQDDSEKDPPKKLVSVPCVAH